jgi:hypothetical protein
LRCRTASAAFPQESDVNPADNAEVVRAIARAIHCYVIAHPDAADTLDGIHRWWLLPTLHEESILRVEEAVEQLVAEGVLRSISREDGRVIYFYAQRRM